MCPRELTSIPAFSIRSPPHLGNTTQGAKRFLRLDRRAVRKSGDDGSQTIVLDGQDLGVTEVAPALGLERFDEPGR